VTEAELRAEPAPALEPLDLALGMPLGHDPIPPLPTSTSQLSPVEAIEGVLLEALARPPCLLSFSGGLDSSSLLALAVRIARREGLDLPVPATLVFPTVEESNEDEWQSLVLGHLGITEWERIVIHDDQFDAVGEVASRAMTRHGLLWPFNTHWQLPIVERAAGGSVVTGFGGDELGLNLAAARAERMLAERRIRHWRDLLVVGFALSPKPLRGAVYRHRAPVDYLSQVTWLTGEGRQRVARAYGRSQVGFPLGWEAKLRHGLWSLRLLRIAIESYRVLAAYDRVRFVHPYLDGRVLDALARVGGFRGLGESREDLMRYLFDEIVPNELIERKTKATFHGALWTDTAARFAQEWSGGGLDRSLVDAEALRRHWSGSFPTAQSATLLQAAWLYDHVGEIRSASR
jgi:hypothetical protein